MIGKDFYYEKNLLFVIVIFVLFNNLSVFVFDDITANVNQINSMIQDGQYLDAIKECNQTLALHNCSSDYINILNSLKELANKNYTILNSLLKLSKEDIEITINPSASAALFVNRSNAPYKFSLISMNNGLIMRHYHNIL